MNKKEILKKIIAEQETSISELEKSIDALRTAADLDETETFDPEDMSHQAESKDMQMRLQLQLAKAKANLDALNKFNTAGMSEGGSGALVVTGKQIFLMGISAPSMDINGNNIVFVSEDAPAFGLMKGIKPGKEFQLGTHKYKVKEIL